MEIFKFIGTNWELISGIIFTIFGPVIAWVVGRKRKEAQLIREQAEAKDVQLGTISTNFKMYQQLIDDLELRFKRRIEELEEDLDKMKTLNTELRKAISNQEKYIQKLKERLRNYEKLEG